MAIDPTKFRQQFPCFQVDEPMLYFDSAATAQVPQDVLNAMHRYYTEYKANVHRGVHAKTDQATNAFEEARSTVQQFMNAKHSSEIIFTKNCTESLNLVAQSWAKQNLQKGDVVLLSILEHHSNIVPWLQLQEEIGIAIRWWQDLAQEPQLDDVKLIAITGQSNVTGEQLDVKMITAKAHKVGAKVLVDAAQLVVHHQVDVQAIQCDFLAFSGHKLYGPTGIGVLYATQEMQAQMAPYQGGGGMIAEVQLDGFTAADAPAKFEAGTPPIAEAIGLAAAIKWLQQYSWRDIEAYEKELSAYAYEKLSTINKLSTFNFQLSTHPSCISFTIDGVHPHDLTDLLGQQNMHLRAGHHCTQPLHDHLGMNASTRLSLALYNTKEEIDTLITALKEVIQKLR